MPPHGAGERRSLTCGSRPVRAEQKITDSAAPAAHDEQAKGTGSACSNRRRFFRVHLPVNVAVVVVVVAILVALTVQVAIQVNLPILVTFAIPVAIGATRHLP